MTEAYPLQWPAGRPRTISPSRSKFAARSIDGATKKVMLELRRMHASNVVISTNLVLRLDGLPRSGQAQPQDKGVAVYFTYKSRPMCFACDRWDTIQDNIYAVAQTIDALRGIERWGSGSMVEQAFTGFVALPAPASHWDILNVNPGSTRDQIEHAYREKAKRAHPDAGGSTDAMARLNDAKAAALQAAK